MPLFEGTQKKSMSEGKQMEKPKNFSETKLNLGAEVFLKSKGLKLSRSSLLLLNLDWHI